MSQRFNKLLFNAGSRIYDILTFQDVWREQIADVLEHIGEPQKIRRILDLGCGPGVSAFVLAERLPRAQVDGVDLAEKMIERAEFHHGESFSHLKNVEFHVGDATKLPWEDGTFDLAIGHSFLYLVPDQAAVLAEARRLLAPGGTMVLLEPNRTGNFRGAFGRKFGRDFEAHRFRDVSRFGMSMVAWRIVSGNVGRLDPTVVRRWILDAGFDRAEISSTLGGLGMHCIGRVDPVEDAQSDAN